MLEIAATAGSLLALGVGGYNAWTRVQMKLEVARTKAAVEAELAALRLHIAENYVSHNALDKTLEDIREVLRELVTQVRSLQRLVDRRLGGKDVD